MRATEVERRAEPAGRSRRSRTVGPGGIRSFHPGWVWGIATLVVLSGSVAFFTAHRAGQAPPAGDLRSLSAFSGPRLEGRGGDAARELDALAERTRDALGRGDWAEAWRGSRAMLQHSPGNPTALTYQALVRFTMGQPEAAILTLQRAQAAAPDLLDSYAVLSLIYAKTGHLELARQTITQAAQRFPSRRPVLGQMFAELRSQVVAEQIAAAGAPSPDRMVSAHSSGLDPPPDLDQGALRAAGVLRLASATRPAAGPAVVFLIVRAAESSEGEPVALRRIATSSFPVQFSIHDADSLVGEPLPSRFHIEARLDSDGDPETRSPGDLSVDSGPIAAGTRTLELILR